jgi:nitrite reductase/ring-hydroxylating ferredoxin subunit
MTRKVGLASDVPVGSVKEVGRYAVGNNGAYFAVSRRCRHLGANLAEGSIDNDGCLVCPWHQAKYDVTTGRMVRGPQGIFAKIPGLDATFKALTAVLPLRRLTVSQRGDDLYLDD